MHLFRINCSRYTCREHTVWNATSLLESFCTGYQESDVLIDLACLNKASRAVGVRSLKCKPHTVIWSVTQFQPSAQLYVIATMLLCMSALSEISKLQRLPYSLCWISDPVSSFLNPEIQPFPSHSFEKHLHSLPGISSVVRVSHYVRIRICLTNLTL